MPEIEYVWDELSDNVIEEYEDGVLSVSYDHEPGLYGNLLSQNRSGVTSYYHYDGRGDTVALTDDSGTVTDTKEYDAWGNVIASTGSTVTPYQFGGRQGYQTGNTGVYVRERAFQQGIARWISPNAGTAAVQGYVRSAYGLDEPMTPEVLHCLELLQATVSSWKGLGLNCAADLLAAALTGKPNACPDGCTDALNKIGYSYISFCAEIGFAKKGECGAKNNFPFKSKGSHKIIDPMTTGGLATNSADLFWGLGKFEWSADGFCSWDCEPNQYPSDQLGGQCCPCTGVCGFEIVITDTYNFDPPPAKPPVIPDPLYCAKLLQKVGKLKTFPVRCPVGLHNRLKISGHRCDWCKPVLSDIAGERPIYDPSSGEGVCPGTVSGQNGKPIFRNPKRVYE